MGSLRWPAVVLALALLGCATDRPPPGTLINVKIESTQEAEPVAPSALSIAPLAGAAPEPGVEDALRRSLSLRGIAVEPDAPFVLRYAYVGVPKTFEDQSLGISFGGVIGSSGTRDVGVGLDLPLFEEVPGNQGIAFRLDLTLERRDGKRLWRGRADGQARLLAPGAIARPVVPLLLNRLGETSSRQTFTR